MDPSAVYPSQDRDTISFSRMEKTILESIRSLASACDGIQTDDRDSVLNFWECSKKLCEELSDVNEFVSNLPQPCDLNGDTLSKLFGIWQSVWEYYRTFSATLNRVQCTPDTSEVADGLSACQRACIDQMKRVLASIQNHSDGEQDNKASEIARISISNLLQVCRWASSSAGNFVLMKESWTELTSLTQRIGSGVDSETALCVFNTLLERLRQDLDEMKQVITEGFRESIPPEGKTFVERGLKVIRFHIKMFQSICVNLAHHFSDSCAVTTGQFIVDLYSLQFLHGNFAYFHLISDGLGFISPSLDALVQSLLVESSTPEGAQLVFIRCFTVTEEECTPDLKEPRNALSLKERIMFAKFQRLQNLLCFGAQMTLSIQNVICREVLPSLLRALSSAYAPLLHPFQCQLATERSFSPLQSHTNSVASACVFVQTCHVEVFPLVEQFLFEHIVNQNESVYRFTADLWCFVLEQASDEIRKGHIEILLKLIPSAPAPLSIPHARIVRFLCEAMIGFGGELRSRLLTSLILTPPGDITPLNRAAIHALPLSQMDARSVCRVVERVLGAKCARVTGTNAVLDRLEALSSLSPLLRSISPSEWPSEFPLSTIAHAVTRTLTEIMHPTGGGGGHTGSVSSGVHSDTLAARLLNDAITCSGLLLRQMNGYDLSEVLRCWEHFYSISHCRVAIARGLRHMGALPPERLQAQVISSLRKLFHQTLSSPQPPKSTGNLQTIILREVSFESFYNFARLTRFTRTQSLIPARFTEAVVEYLQNMPVQMTSAQEVFWLQRENSKRLKYYRERSKRQLDTPHTNLPTSVWGTLSEVRRALESDLTGADIQFCRGRELSVSVRVNGVNECVSVTV
eukprot:982435_1